MTDTIIDLIASSIPEGRHYLTGKGPAYYADLESLPDARIRVSRAWLWVGDPCASEAYPAVMLTVVRMNGHECQWGGAIANIPMRVFTPSKSGGMTAFSEAICRMEKISETI
jgi:hypothetical protein